MPETLRGYFRHGAPHETVSGKSRNWTLYNLSKFTHPGVQVLPSECLWGGACWVVVPYDQMH